MLLTRTEAADALGVQRRDVAYLADAGVLRTVRAGARDLVVSDDVDDLREFRPLGHHPAALVVRVAPAERVDDPDRAFKGYATVYDAALGEAENERIRRDALRSRWQVAGPETWIGSPLVASLAGFVVAVYAITGLDELDDRAVTGTRFSIELPANDQRAAFERRRIPPIQGSQITRLSASGVS